MVRRWPRGIHYLGLLLALLLLQSCGWRDSGTDQSDVSSAATTLPGTVSVAVVAEGLPQSAPVESVQVVAGLNSSSLDEANAGGVQLNSEAPQVVSLTSENGEILLMGLSLYPSEGSSLTLSPASTAQSLVFLNPFFAALLYRGEEADKTVLDTVAALPEVQALADLIDQRLSGNQSDYLAVEDPEMEAALAAAVEAALIALQPGPEAQGAAPGDPGPDRLADLQVTAPGGDRGMVSVEDSLIDGTRHRFSLTNSAQRYLHAELVKEDGTQLGEPKGIFVGPASNVVSFTPLTPSTGSMEVDATDLANGKAKIKIYGPGKGMDQVPWEKVWFPLVNTINTEFAAPVIGLILPVYGDCLVNMISNINAMVLNENIVQSTMRTLVEEGSTLSAVLYLSKAIVSAFLTDKSDVRTLSLSECAASLGNKAMEVGIKKALEKFGTIAGRAVIAYQVVTTTAELSTSFASVFFNPAYLEWQVDNFLRVTVNADADYGARTGNFLAYCSPGATCGRVSWDFGDGTSQEAESGQLITHSYAEDGEYTVTVSLTDSDGATRTEDPAAMSTVLTISSAPQVIATNPAANETGVLPEEVRVTFSQLMDPATITPYNLFLKRVNSDGRDDGAPLDAGISYDAGSKSAVLTPAVSLEENASYRVYVGLGSGMKSADGILLLEVKKFDFSTPDNLPPEVIDTSPYKGGIAEIDPEIRAVFNEPVAPASVTGETFTLVDANGQAVAGSVTVSSDNRSAIFTLSGSLEKETAYTASLAGVTDLSGNSMAGPYSWTFYTITDQIDLQGLAVLAMRREDSDLERLALKSLDGEKELLINNISAAGSSSSMDWWKVTPDGGRIIATKANWSYQSGVRNIWTGYIVKPPLVPKPDGTWAADIEETVYDIGGSGVNTTYWGQRLAELTAVDGACVKLAPGAVADPDQWVENVNTQIWSGTCGADDFVQVTHVGRADLRGSSDPEDPDYNPAYGNMDYHPEVFCTRDPSSCGAYANFYSGDADRQGTGIWDASVAEDGSILFLTFSSGLYRLSGDSIGYVGPGFGPAIYPDRNFSLAQLSYYNYAIDRGYSYVGIQSLDGSLTKYLYAEAPEVPSYSAHLYIDNNLYGSPHDPHQLVTELEPWIHGDSDGDSLDNWEEHLLGLDGGNPDTDGDGLTDSEELALGTDPLKRDTDGDYLPDGMELELGTDPLNPDTDGDGVVDGWEVKVLGTDPLVPDTDVDQDGVSNEEEKALGTDPLNPDTDGDGLTDGEEIDHYTNPLNPDTDGDGLPDGLEVAAGLDPRVAESDDHDGDGVSNRDEVHFGTAPLDPQDVPIIGYTVTELSRFGVFNQGETIVAGATDIRGDGRTLIDILPWAFPFYGLKVQEIAADTHGNVWLTKDADDEGDYHFQLAEPQAPVLALWNAELDSRRGGEGLRVRHLGSPARVVVNWDTETNSEGRSGRINNLEAVLYPNGYILYRYNLMATQNEEDYGSGISLANGVDFVNQTDELGVPVPRLGGRVFLYEPHLAGDRDGDGLTDDEEAALGTAPDNPDSNGDGVKDGWHVYILGTDPLSDDSDGDGLTNAEELALGTNPVLADSDNDGLIDAVETNSGVYVGATDTGTDPLNPDSDGDGVPDGAEVAAGFDPLVAQTDHDGDGIDSLTEAANGTDPLNPDTDGDGLSDSEELALGTDPLKWDTDGDGLSDAVETNSGVYIDADDTGTDPLNTDTDGDGVSDGTEHLFGSSPLDAGSLPLTFTAAAPVEMPLYPTVMVPADLDLDGDLDLLATTRYNYENGYVTLVNDGSLLAVAHAGNGGYERYHAAAVADLNGDGRPDLVLSSNNHGQVDVLFAAEGGGYDLAQQLPAGWARGVAVGDLDEDGWPDILAADDSDGLVRLYRNEDGSFSAGTTLSVAADYYPTSVTVADFDGDGHQDIAVASEYEYEVAFAAGDGSGGFAAPLLFNTSGEPVTLVSADVDNDGRPELLAPTWDGTLLVLHLREGVWNTGAIIRDLGWPYYPLAVADFNGDGNPDLAVSSADGITLHLGDGSGGFHFAATLAQSSPEALAAIDVNSDGRPDLVASDWSADNSEQLTVWLNATPSAQ